MSRLLFALPLVLSLSLSACGESSSEKGEETPMPAADGKSNT